MYLCVCLCVCVGVCMYVCVYVCVCMCVCRCMYVCTWTQTVEDIFRIIVSERLTGIRTAFFLEVLLFCWRFFTILRKLAEVGFFVCQGYYECQSYLFICGKALSEYSPLFLCSRGSGNSISRAFDCQFNNQCLLWVCRAPGAPFFRGYHPP